MMLNLLLCLLASTAAVIAGEGPTTSKIKPTSPKSPTSVDSKLPKSHADKQKRKDLSRERNRARQIKADRYSPFND